MFKFVAFACFIGVSAFLLNYLIDFPDYNSQCGSVNTDRAFLEQFCNLNITCQSKPSQLDWMPWYKVSASALSKLNNFVFQKNFNIYEIRGS